MRRSRFFLALAFVGAVAALAAAAAAPAPVSPPRAHPAAAKVDLTGMWQANDGAMYWVRQISSSVWWAGFSGPLDSATMGKSFSNVFAGTLSADGLILAGTWADVPRGGTRGNGKLWLRVQSATLMTRIKSPGSAFGATIWRKVG